MDAAWLTWLLDNVPTRLLDALEILAIAYLLWVVKTENKKMLALMAKTKSDVYASINKAKTDADTAYAPLAVKGDVQDLKAEISSIRDKMDAGFNSISLQISGLSQAVIAAVSQK